MKIRVKEMPLDRVLTLPGEKHLTPKKPSLLIRTLLKEISRGSLRKVHFTHTEVGMEKLGKDEPCLFLMNHSCFLDLHIAASLLYPRPFQIICTEDGFVGKKRLMRAMGCIPTKKFMTDTQLVRDMVFALKKNRCSVLMYPEASYSFDGTATPLPESVAKCIRLLGVPVVMITTYGAFGRDPLYNNLQLRQVDVSAKMEYLLSPEEIRGKNTSEIHEVLKKAFSFDNFRWQQENHVKISEPFRADYLNRVLYKCPHCLAEGKTVGQGTTLTCRSCGARYELGEEGDLRCLTGQAKFTHVPDWYRWERESVHQELTDNTYSMACDVEICAMVDLKCIYKVGKGKLTHTPDGFHLTGCDGKLDFIQRPGASYGLYADYYWYELGDMICIGDSRILYYCFPIGCGDIVAKTRLAAEELFRLHGERKKSAGRGKSSTAGENS